MDYYAKGYLFYYYTNQFYFVTKIFCSIISREERDIGLFIIKVPKVIRRDYL